MPELAWDPIVESLIGDRTQKPRAAGVTMVIDTGVALGLLRDTLELAGHCIDHWKLSFGTSVFLTKQVLQRKLALLAEYEVLTFPGGTLLEVALVERHCRDYMKHAKTLGFSAVEISDGTIPMPAFRRRNIIHCALDAGLVPITEVGKKDPKRQLYVSAGGAADHLRPLSARFRLSYAARPRSHSSALRACESKSRGMWQHQWFAPAAGS